MKKSSFLRAMIGLLCLGLLLSLAVASVQARPLSAELGAEPALPAKAADRLAQVYNPALFTASWGTPPDMMISCDPDNELLFEVQPGQVRSTNSLQSAVCRKQVAAEAAAARSAVSAQSASGVAFSGAVSLSAASSSTSSPGSCSSGYGVTGDGRNLKISSGYSDTRYVIYQCGKKVAEYGPPTCSCNSGFRYGYSCKKPPTVIITLPCH